MLTRSRRQTMWKEEAYSPLSANNLRVVCQVGRSEVSEAVGQMDLMQYSRNRSQMFHFVIFKLLENESMKQLPRFYLQLGLFSIGRVVNASNLMPHTILSVVPRNSLPWSRKATKSDTHCTLRNRRIILSLPIWTPGHFPPTISR